MCADVCVHAHVHVCELLWVVRGQLSGMGSLLPPWDQGIKLRLPALQGKCFCLLSRPAHPDLLFWEPKFLLVEYLTHSPMDMQQNYG